MLANWADSIPDWVVVAVMGNPVALVILSLYLIFRGLPKFSDAREKGEEK